MVGRFIVFEGGEGCGKSTQAALLAKMLGAILTREPGGTELGEALRGLLLRRSDARDSLDQDIHPRAETLMMLAARAQHVEQVIKPALEAGQDVVCDRFSGSTLAYQGYGRGLEHTHLSNMSDWAAGGLRPDLVILLKVPSAVARARRAERYGGPDRIEAEGDEFLAKVEQGFNLLAAADPDIWKVVDGDGDINTVAQRIAAVAKLD